MILPRGIAAILALAALVAAQPSDSQSRDPVIRVSVNLAQTDVVVTDSAGRPVTDLEAHDFQLSEDGKPQAITNFSWVDVVPSTLARPATVRNTTGGMPPASIASREDLRRAIVLMVDDAGTNTSDLAGILPALRHFIDEQIEPGDLAAITASRGGMGVYEHLTSDKRQLFAAVDQIGRRPGWLSCDYVPPFVSANNAKYFQYVPGDFILSAHACQPADKNGYLKWAIEGLSGFPGRKAVVLFSHSFGPSPANTAAANRAGVVIYVLDPTGAGGATKARQPGPKGVEAAAALAAQTGGFRNLTTPSQIGQDLGRVLQDMSGYYLLGYHPSRSDSELQGHDVQHAIQVRVLRQGLVVRARSTIAPFEPAAAAKPPQTREEYLQQALFSPFSSGGLRLRIEPAFTASGYDPKTKRRGIDLRLNMTLENGAEANPASLTVDTMVVVLRSDGTAAMSVDKRVNIREITPEQAAGFRAYGVRFTMQLGITQPGNYQIRAAVRDPDSGKSGSAYTFLALPDFNRGALTLATPALTASSWNEFTPGQTVHFSCELFGSSAGRTQGEIRLYSQSEAVSAPRVLSRQSKNGSTFLEGDMPLPADLAPGEYAIRLVTWDGAIGPSKPTASYWSELKILNGEP
jgi:VWFA-related protein